MFEDRIKALQGEVERELSEFAEACREKEEGIVLHQDAFAAEYQAEEYRLLGMAIKYAGLKGKTVTIVPTPS